MACPTLGKIICIQSLASSPTQKTASRTWSPRATRGVPCGDHPVDLAVADFNNGQILDIAVASEATSAVNLLFGRGDGTFYLGQSLPLPLPQKPTALATADLSRDGKPDPIVGTGAGFSVFVNVSP